MVVLSLIVDHALFCKAWPGFEYSYVKETRFLSFSALWFTGGRVALGGGSLVIAVWVPSPECIVGSLCELRKELYSHIGSLVCWVDTDISLSVYKDFSNCFSSRTDRWRFACTAVCTSCQVMALLSCDRPFQGVFGEGAPQLYLVLTLIASLLANITACSFGEDDRCWYRGGGISNPCVCSQHRRQ